MGRVSTSRVSAVLLCLAVVPVAAYVAGSLATPGPATPPDHSPVILQDREPGGSPSPQSPGSRSGAPRPDRDDRDDERPSGGRERDDGDEARVVTPTPTPVGEDDDDEWDDDEHDDEHDEDGDGTTTEAGDD